MAVKSACTWCLVVTKANLTPALKDMETQVRRGLLRFSLRVALAVAQVVASVFLMVTAGMFLRSYINTFDAKVGFDGNALYRHADVVAQAG